MRRKGSLKFVAPATLLQRREHIKLDNAAWELILWWIFVFNTSQLLKSGITIRHMIIVPRGHRLRARYVVELSLRSRNLLRKTRENWIRLVGFSQRVMWSKKAASKPQKPRIKNINRRTERGRKIAVCIFQHISGQTAVCLVDLLLENLQLLCYFSKASYFQTQTPDDEDEFGGIAPACFALTLCSTQGFFGENVIDVFLSQTEMTQLWSFYLDQYWASVCASQRFTRDRFYSSALFKKLFRIQLNWTTEVIILYSKYSNKTNLFSASNYCVMTNKMYFYNL